MGYDSTSWTTSGTTNTVSAPDLFLYKQFGLADFSITAGVHNPLVCNTPLYSGSGTKLAEDSSMFGNGTNPATSVDISADGTPEFLIPCLWPIRDTITLSRISVLAAGNQSTATDTLSFNLMSYDIDLTTGDLSNGDVLATRSIEVNNSSIKGIDLSIVSSKDVVQGSTTKVIIMLVENQDSTEDITINSIVKYKVN